MTQFEEQVAAAVRSIPLSLENVLVFDVTEETLAATRAGMVLVHATWSGVSKAALNTVVDVLSSRSGRPPLYVVDQETEALAVERVLGCLPHGRGELFLVRDGKVVELLGGFGGNSKRLASAVAAIFD